jgi:hypothetical protein
VSDDAGWFASDGVTIGKSDGRVRWFGISSFCTDPRHPSRNGRNLPMSCSGSNYGRSRGGGTKGSHRSNVDPTPRAGHCLLWVVERPTDVSLFAKADGEN